MGGADFLAIGSGQGYALGAYQMMVEVGHDRLPSVLLTDILKVAVKWDYGTAGPFRVLQVPPLEMPADEAATMTDVPEIEGSGPDETFQQSLQRRGIFRPRSV
jgi:hypothetical protein